MLSKHIENTIIKYLNNQASISELEELEVWIEKPENEKLFIDYVRLNFAIDFNLKKFDSFKIKNQLNSLIKNNSRRSFNRKLIELSKYAAILLIILSIVLFYESDINKVKNSNQSLAGEVTLRTESGEIQVLQSNSNSKIKNRNGNIIASHRKNELTYDSHKSNELVYNTLTVPYGRKFSLNLSDGSKVTLNAGTSLKYPINFIEGQPRKVFIENGEAFFDISKDSLHPFIVNDNNINIKVLGTKFNVSSYHEDEYTTTVLVEGSIQLSNSNSNVKRDDIVLKPGFKASFSKKLKSLDISEADVEFHTAWLSDKIILKHMKFETIEKRLERRYNVTIENNDKSLNNEYLTATFKEESIDEVLYLISKLHPINFEINDNKIIILKK